LFVELLPMFVYLTVGRESILSPSWPLKLMSSMVTSLFLFLWQPTLDQREPSKSFPC
jgi:hypothetical protein